MKENGSRILLSVPIPFLVALIISMRKRTQGKKGLPELTVSEAAVYHVRGRDRAGHPVSAVRKEQEILEFPLLFQAVLFLSSDCILVSDDFGFLLFLNVSFCPVLGNKAHCWIFF